MLNAVQASMRIIIVEHTDPPFVNSSTTIDGLQASNWTYFPCNWAHYAVMDLQVGVTYNLVLC